LIVACEELRVFGVYEKVLEKIQEMPGTVPDLFEEVSGREKVGGGERRKGGGRKRRERRREVRNTRKRSGPA
jgi:hypothetical protein